MLGPSQMPPAAMTGPSPSSRRAAAAPSSRRRAVLEAAAFAALDDEPVDARVDRLQRRFERRHDVEDGEPAAFSCFVYCRGSPADVVTNFTPCATTKSTMPGRGRRAARCSRRRAVREVAHLPDLVLHDVELAGRRLDDAEAAAFETADASCARAIQPIGAWTIG
jgi:hypothetical protein